LTLSNLYKKRKKKGYQIMSTYFSLIPSGVLENENISDSSKLTYALILGLSNRYGYCFAGNEQLAHMRKLSVSGIKRHLLELRLGGCIELEFTPRNDRRITPIISPTNFEKVAKNSKNKQYNQYNDEETNNVLDQLWKKLK